MRPRCSTSSAHCGRTARRVRCSIHIVSGATSRPRTTACGSSISVATRHAALASFRFVRRRVGDTARNVTARITRSGRTWRIQRGSMRHHHRFDRRGAPVTPRGAIRRQTARPYRWGFLRRLANSGLPRQSINGISFVPRAPTKRTAALAQAQQSDQQSAWRSIEGLQEGWLSAPLVRPSERRPSRPQHPYPPGMDRQRQRRQQWRQTCC